MNYQFTVNSFSDIEHSLQNACDKLEDPEGLNLIYRGHSVSTWDLIPHAGRFYKNLSHEQGATRRFKMKAQSRHQHLPDPSDLPAWLFLMQHYGHPTRLLDWSESFLCALFFAVEDTQHSKEDGAVWVLNTSKLNGDLALSGASDPKGAQEAFSLPFKADTPPNLGSFKAGAILPKESDLRMLVQLAGFTIHGGWPIEPLNGLDGCDKFLHKFIVPASAKEKLFKFLYRLGIRRANLFPDLANLAEEIKSIKFR